MCVNLCTYVDDDSPCWSHQACWGSVADVGHSSPHSHAWQKAAAAVAAAAAAELSVSIWDRLSLWLSQLRWKWWGPTWAPYVNQQPLLLSNPCLGLHRLQSFVAVNQVNRHESLVPQRSSGEHLAWFMMKAQHVVCEYGNERVLWRYNKSHLVFLHF